MDEYDFEAQPELKRDRIYVSWNEQWDLRRYAEQDFVGYYSEFQAQNFAASVWSSWRSCTRTS